MAKRFVDYDPLSGNTTYVDYNAVTDTTTVITEFADLEPLLDRNKALANEDEYTKRGIKEDFWHYSTIPASIEMKWLVELGVNIHNRNHNKKVWQLINSPEYRYLKTTAKYHQPIR